MTTPFPVIAAALARLARREAGGLEAVEIEAARDPGSAVARLLPSLQADTALLVEAHRILTLLAGREPAARALLDLEART